MKQNGHATNHPPDTRNIPQIYDVPAYYRYGTSVDNSITGSTILKKQNNKSTNRRKTEQYKVVTKIRYQK